MSDAEITSLEEAFACLGVLRRLADPEPEAGPEPIPTSLEYERFVEAPRRAGRDPVWQAMLAEAMGPSAKRRAS